MNDINPVIERLFDSQIYVYSFSRQLAGQGTEGFMINLPDNAFALNVIFYNTQGVCDNYTHFGSEIERRQIILRNSANNVPVLFDIGKDRMTVDTSASGITMRVQVLYFQK